MGVQLKLLIVIPLTGSIEVGSKSEIEETIRNIQEHQPIGMEYLPKLKSDYTKVSFATVILRRIGTRYEI